MRTAYAAVTVHYNGRAPWNLLKPLGELAEWDEYSPIDPRDLILEWFAYVEESEILAGCAFPV